MGSVAQLDVNVEEGEIDDLLANRHITLFSGASKSSWKNVPEDQQQNVVDTMTAYVATLDGRKDVVISLRPSQAR